MSIASKNLSKTLSETRAKWLRFGAVSETPGFANFSKSGHSGAFKPGLDIVESHMTSLNQKGALFLGSVVMLF